MKFKYKVIILILGIVLGGFIASYSTYAATTHAINSSNVKYTDNHSLGATDVQSAIDKTCSNIDNRLSIIETEEGRKNYSAPFSTLPTGYSASAYKENGIIVLVLTIPAGHSGWLTTSSFSLIPELRPYGYINGAIRYSSSSDASKIFLSLNGDGTLYGLINSTLNSQAYATFIYPAQS